MRKSLSTHGRSLQHLKKKFLLPVLLFLWSGSVWGQVSVTALPQTYTQDFNTLSTTSSTFTDNSTLPSWYISSTTLPTDAGGANSNSCYNYGTASSTDRSIGAISTATTHNFGFRIKNNSSTTITALDVSFVGEQWRQTANAQILAFSYQISTSAITSLTAGTWVNATALDFTAPKTGTAGALDGNATGNRTAISGILSVSIPAGSEIFLRWTKAGSTSPGLSVDDLSVTARLAGATITSSATALTGFSATPSTASAQQTFSVSGSALTNDISIAPSTNYEISTVSGVGFTATNPITLTRTSGTVATTPIYVRLKAGLALGAYNGEIINITSTGATAKTVTVSGDVIRNTITSTTSGDWSAGSTWIGGVVPTSADNVVIATGHTVSLATAVTRDSGVTTTVNGSFQLNNGGYAGGTAFTYAATGSGLIFNNGSVYGVGSGNAFWPTANPPFNVTVNTGSGARLDTSVGAVAGTLTLNGQLDAANAITVNGTLQLNAGGYVSSNAPVYGAASTLLYNTTYGVGTEWTTTGTTAGAGIPNHVTIQNNAAVAYSAGSARGMAGNLTITSGSLTSGDVLNIKGTTTNAGTLTTNSTANFTGAVSNSGTFNSNNISNLASNFTNTGTLNLSSSIGNDFYVGGNWTNTGGTFNSNSRAVFFNAATGTQTITNTAGETFDYLTHSGAGLLKLNNNVTVKGYVGDILQLLAGTVDLNAKSLTLSGTGGNVKVAAGQILNSATSGATFSITNGTKTITGGTLSIPVNVTTILNNGIDFGNNLTTLAGTLRVATGGFVSNNAPIYANGSTLEYNGVTSYGVNNEWTGNAATAGVGVPHNVTLTNASINMPASARGMGGNLSIGTGSTLNLSTTLAADFALAGNFANNGTFVPNSRAVIFNGNDITQTISGATTYDYFIVNKTGTLGTVTLASSIIINKDLTLTSRSITLSSFNLTLPNKSSVITSNVNSYINATGTGKLIRQNLDGTADWIFPMGVAATGRYAPLTIKSLSGTTEIGVNVNATFSKSVSVAANTLKTEWRVSSTNNVTANVRADWTATEQNTGVVNPGSGDLGVYNSTVGANYTLYDVTLAQYNTQATGVSLANTGTNSIVIGNDDSITLSNDECAGAKTVVLDAASISGSNAGATQSIAPITCASFTSSAASDVWYKFTTADAGYYKVDVVLGTISDAVLDLRSGSCTGTNIACSDTSGNESITMQLLANTTYYYRVYSFGSGSGTFTTSVSAVPTLIATPSTLNFGDVSVVTNSASQSFTLSGSLLKSYPGNIVVNATAGFQVSLDNAAWASSVNVPFASSALASTLIYARLASTTTCGVVTGNVTFSGGGVATPPTVALTANAILLSPAATAATDITATTFTAHWGSVSGATGYELDVSTIPAFGSGTSGSITEGFESTTFPPTGWLNTNWVRSTAAGDYNSGVAAATATSTTGTLTTKVVANPTSMTFYLGRSSNTTAKTLTVEVSTTSQTSGFSTLMTYDHTNVPVSSYNQYTVDLSAYTSYPAVYIRFNKSSSTTSPWRLDDVVINYNSFTPSYVSGYNALPVSGTSSIVTGLSPNTQYYYRVRAVNASCKSANSNVISAATNNNVVWNAGAWSNTNGPDATLDGIIRSTYSVGDVDQPAFTVKNLTVENTGLLEIKANNGITVTGAITTADNKIVIDSDGSLLQTNAPAINTNSGKIIAKRDVKMSLSDYTYWSTPVEGQILKNTATGSGPTTYTTGGFSEGTPNNRIYDYYEPTDNFKATADANFTTAKGYAIRGKNSYSTTLHTLDTSLKFTGVANNGVYSIGIQKSKNTTAGTPPTTYTHGYNLIGNPYPSNINFITFYNLERDGVKNSDVINAKAWFWTNSSPSVTQGGSAYSGNNYATITLAGGASPTTVNSTTGTPTPNEFIKVGQGFIVEMLGTPPTGTTPNTATLKFDNTIRTNNSTGHFYNNNKSTDAINRYWVKLVSPENIVNTILLAHMDGATNNYDANYDAELLTVGDDSFYSKLNTQKLQIQARSNPLNNDDIIALGTKYATSGIYKISLGNKEGIFATDHKIYLKDKLTNSYTDLTADDYSFAANKGIDENRFEIVYKEDAVLGTDVITKSDFTVYKDGESYIVKSSKALGKIEVYDTSGRMLITSTTRENSIKIDASMLINGVYIIKAENSGEMKTKKIIK